MSNVETVNYRVRRGDTVQDIVQNAGFPRRDWRRIYDAPYNRQFRRRRPDPDHIESGDTFVLPRYNQRDIANLLRQVEQLRARVDRVNQGLDRVERQLASAEAVVNRREELSREQLVSLRREANHLSDLVNEASGECSDEWSCVGAGLAAQSMANRERAVNQQIRALERARDQAANKAARALRGIRQELQRLRRAQRDALTELRQANATYRRASRAPY